MEYTIKDVAELIGTTKNTIKYRMKKLPPELIRNVGGQWFISEAGYNRLKDDFQIEEKEPEKEAVYPGYGKPENASFVDVLSEQIAFLQEQIKVKDRQIEDLSASLKAEQTINIQNVGLLKQREEVILKLEADAKRSWFSRVFHRDKKVG